MASPHWFVIRLTKGFTRLSGAGICGGIGGMSEWMYCKICGNEHENMTACPPPTIREPEAERATLVHRPEPGEPEQSETPRVDSAVVDKDEIAHPRNYRWWVHADFARELERQNQRLREQVSKLTGVPQGSPFQDEGCAFTFSDWMRTRQKALDERDQWRAVAQEQRNAFARISAWGAYAYHPKTASLFETAQALEANLAECQKEAVQQIAALDKLNTP